MSKDESQSRTVYPHWLFPALLIIVAGFGLLAGVQISNMYDVAHPQISTVISSATVSQTQTETDTSYSTLTQTSVSTSTQNQNGNFYFGNQNYPNYNYNNPYPNYPNYQCQYPYYSQCYGNQYPNNPGGQEQRIFGQIYGQGACVYLQSYQSYQYGPVYALYNVPGNYQNGSYVTVYGYLTNNYNQCAGGTGFSVVQIVSQ